jgi:hypothetical protein
MRVEAWSRPLEVSSLLGVVIAVLEYQNGKGVTINKPMLRYQKSTVFFSRLENFSTFKRQTGPKNGGKSEKYTFG